ncbi:hypothetical protein [Sphingomonas bacterium]|uniref:hypothetical protein n=1 Tax=Sphingomonas bacterium TaxID=1895847 RepID=UPI001575F22D|nr:hypothetical protein [Sphingomonas bacterium]
MIAGLCLAAALAATRPADRADPASASVASAGPQPDIVGDAELATQRGGFRIGQLDVQLGVDLRSYVGGKLVMRTDLAWTDLSTSVRHGSGADLSPAAANSLVAGLLTGSGMTLNLGGGTVVLANEGRTAFIQRTDGSIQNIVVNTASNVDLRQQVDISLDIAGFAPFRHDIGAMRVGAALIQSMLSARRSN